MGGFCGPTIYNSVHNLFDEDTLNLEVREGLTLAELQFVPHLNSPHSPKVQRANVLEAAEDMQERVYAMDDDTALMVTDGEVSVVGDGEWVEG